MKFLDGFVKTVFDYTLTAVGTICISPLLAYIAYRIKKEDQGPVFFAHTRIGKNGKPFPCFKFRSMVVNSQEMLQKYLSENPAAREEWERDFKLKDDPRVTPIGKVLRRTSLDELPQIFNVLRGEMSLVGPRPVIQEELDKYYGETAKLYRTVKLYFRDTGVAAYLLQINDQMALTQSVYLKNLLDNYVVNQIRESYLEQGVEPQLMYYQDSNYKKISLIMCVENVLYPIIISKDDYSVNKVMKTFAVLDVYAAEHGVVVGSGCIIGMGKEAAILEKGLYYLPAAYL